MAPLWKADPLGAVPDFFRPCIGPVQSEFLAAEPGGAALLRKGGEPCVESYIDGGRLARYDFELRVRSSGTDTAHRQKAIDLLNRAAEYCEDHFPCKNGRIVPTDFPQKDHRGSSGEEEYRLNFALLLLTEGEG